MGNDVSGTISKQEWTDDSVATLLGRWLARMREIVANGLPGPEAEREVRRHPPDRLELPDGGTLSGASLAGFLESGHFPFGQYRVGEEQFFVTPSLRLGAETLENLVRRGPGHQPVGRELLVWQPVSFRV